LRRIGEPERFEVGRIERGSVVRGGSVVGVVRVQVGLRAATRVASVPEVSVIVVIRRPAKIKSNII
jgi:hypothetical protein